MELQNHLHNALVEHAKDEEISGKRNEGYFEKHHILPINR